MIGLVTDSNAQLPAGLVERFGVVVVPLGVTVDGQSYLEGVDLDADAFYACFAVGRQPQVSTSQPSPARFATAFDELARRGATEILAVHMAASVSGTLNSARLAAEVAPVPVRTVDSGTASFGVACCVWEAGDALAAGASIAEAAALAEWVGARVATVFTVGALDLARAGGRLAEGGDDGAGVPILTLAGGQMQVVTRVDDIEAALEAMASFVIDSGSGLRAAVGVADEAVRPLARALEQRLEAADEVKEVIAYRIGPSVGAHTGPGTVGAFFYRTGS